MKKQLRTINIIGLAIVLCVVCLAFAGCKKKSATSTPAPTQTPLRALIQSSYDLAAALNSGEKILESVYQAKLIDADDARVCASWMKNAVATNEQYKGRLSSLKFVDFSNKGQIIDWTNEVFASLGNLQVQGLMGIKSDDAKQRLQVALQGVPLILAQIKLIISQIADAPPAPAPTPQAINLLKTSLWEVNFEFNRSSGTDSPTFAVGGGRCTGSNHAHQSPACAALSFRRGFDRANDTNGRGHQQSPVRFSGEAWTRSYSLVPYLGVST